MCLTILGILLLLLVLLKVTQWILGRGCIPSLHTRHVLVTGCDSGFGRRLALRLDKMGCHVFAACLTSEAVSELRGLTSQRVHPFVMDVTKDEDIEAAVETVKKELPQNTGLWGIVNNAGVMGPIGPFECLTRKDYLLTLQINVMGMAQVTRHFLPLVRAERGRIVNTTSVVGRTAVGPAPYVASKFASVGLTDTMRRELRKQGITVHGIQPGAYATNVTDSRLARQGLEHSLGNAPKHVRDYYGGTEYIDKTMEPVDFMNRYITGKNLEEVVDAYVHALTSRRPLTYYVVGWNGNLLFRALWTLPTWLSDLIATAGFPTPAGEIQGSKTAASKTD